MPTRRSRDTSCCPDLQLVYLLWLREDDDRHRPGVNALHSRRQARLGDSLDPMRPSFVFQMPVDIISRNMSGRVMQPTWRGKQHRVTNSAEKPSF